MKVLATAALVVGAVALVATGIGAAASAGLIGVAHGAVTAVNILGLSLTAGTLTSIGALAGLAAAGLTALSQKKPSAVAGGSQIEFSADPNAGVPFMLGNTGTAGNIVFRQSGDGWAGSDTPNDLNDMVVVLSGAGPIQGPLTFTSDKVGITFDGAGNAIGDFRDKMFQKTQLGGTPEAAALTVQAGASSRPTGWTTAHKLSGMAAAIWRLRYDTKQRFFQNGVPQPMWKGPGIKVYDPRQDSTYPGGSGPCRAGIDSTYVWAGVDPSHPAGENPYLVALTWCLGRFANGKRVMGLGAAAASLIMSQFVEGANIADTNGWKVGGVVWSRPDTKWATLKQILQAGMGEPTRVGARIGCLINTPRVSLATIKEADIVGNASFPAMQTTRNRINGAVPRFRDPTQGYAVVDASVVRVPEYVTFDGDEKTKSIEFPLIQDVNQAAVAARYEIENSREFGPGTLPLKPMWIDYKAGDCLTLDTNEIANQKLLILNREIDPASAVVTMTARSETDGKHAFALGQTATPPPTPSIIAYDPSVPAPNPGQWSAVAASPSTGDTPLPSIVVTGSVENGNADGVLFQYRAHDDANAPETGWRGASVEPQTVTRKDIAPGVSGSYDVSVQYRARGVVGARLVLGPVIVDYGAILAELEALQGLVSGKGKAFWQSTPPSADESSESDLWFDTSNGNFLYRRIPGSGRLAFSGSRLTFGGSGLILPPWAPAADQRIASALSQAASAIAQAQAAQATADGAVTAIEALADDGNLSINEKITTLIPKDAQLDGAWALLDAQAADLGVTTERTAAAAARAAWQTYRNGLSPAWNSITADTPVDRTTFRAKLEAYDAALTALQKAISAKAATIANWDGVTGAGKDQLLADMTAAKARIAALGSDAVLSSGSEKQEAIIDWTALDNEYDALQAKYVALGSPADVTAARNAASAANTALSTYLAGLSPAWDSVGTDTPIVAATWESKWNDAYNTNAAFVAAITGRPGDDGATPIVFDLSAKTVNVTADYTGTSKSGQFPKVSNPTATQAGANVLAATTVTLASSSTSIVAAYSISDGVGTVEITQADVAGYVDVTMTNGTYSQTLRISVTRQVDNPPPASQSSASVRPVAIPANATYDGSAIGNQTISLAANASGQLSVSYACSEYFLQGGSGTNKSFAAAGKAQITPIGGSTWTDIGSETTGSVARVIGGDVTPGSLGFSFTATGLTAGAVYTVRVNFRKSSGSAGTSAVLNGYLAVSQ